ncbi:MAG TPA: histone [archaeon]|nr:histone [archaeon]
MSEIPLAAVLRLIKKADPSFRVSEDAGKELREWLEGISKEVSLNARDFAGHANRKTINALDVRLALKDKKLR